MATEQVRMNAADHDSDTYHNLRIRQPIKYGEELARLQESGRTQKEIAEMLSCNRQMVGRYQRMGKWPDEVKAKIDAHRDKLTNTKILSLASRPLTSEELLVEVKAIIGEAMESGEGELKTFPTVNGFNELILRLEAIEQRLDLLEKPQNDPVPQVVITNEIEQILSKDVTLSTKPELRWMDIFRICIGPAGMLLMICITVLTSYLVYQGIMFFSAIDPEPNSAMSSAVISELVPFVAAACLALASDWSHRAAAFLMLMISILGLGIFMHRSLETQVVKGSGAFERLTEHRNLAMASIESYTKTMAALPETYVSRRQEISTNIALERENLAKIDSDISVLESNDGTRNMDLGYAVWIRIAAMLLNAYVIHLFFSLFRRRSDLKSSKYQISHE